MVFTVDEAVNVVLIETLDGAGVSTGFVQHSVRTASDHMSSLSQPEISLLLITASAEGLVLTAKLPDLLGLLELQGTGVDGLIGTPRVQGSSPDP